MISRAKDNHTPEFMKDASPLRKVIKQILNASYQGHKEGCLYCAEVNELADHARPDEYAESDLLGECLDAIRGALRISNLWTISGDIPDSALDEARALGSMKNSFKAILAKRKDSER